MQRLHWVLAPERGLVPVPVQEKGPVSALGQGWASEQVRVQVLGQDLAWVMVQVQVQPRWWCRRLRRRLRARVTELRQTVR